jgi:glycosyltransferase involved in cell wall biosynthesis
MTRTLRVGVPGHLAALPPSSGHGKVWHRVLGELGRSATIVELAQRRGPRSPRRRRLDVVLASGHDELPDTRAPLVVQVHEAGWFQPALRDLLAPEFLADIAPRTEQAVAAADRVIVPSRRARLDLIEDYALAPEKVRAVHHGADPAFRPDAAARAGAGLPPGPYVLYAASLHPRKNLAALREAVTVLAAAGFPHRLVIAGGAAPDRADSSALEHAAAAELRGAPGRVTRICSPSDDELAALMAGADAFCLPSLYEGFGLTALEAMACGVPVVVSDRGSLPEVVGDAGIVTAPTGAATAEALGRVLSEPGLAARLAAAGPARAAEFTWARTAAGWLAVLRDAAGCTDT